MKNYRIITTILITGLLFNACTKKDEDCEPFQPDCDTNVVGLISQAEAETRQNRYIDHQYSAINAYLDGLPGKPVEDNREYWFELSELKNYICLIEQEATKQGLDASSLGIRVYNSAILNESDKPLSSIFFVGTHRPTAGEASGAARSAAMPASNNNENIDMDPMNLGSSGNPPKDFVAN